MGKNQVILNKRLYAFINLTEFKPLFKKYLNTAFQVEKSLIRQNSLGMDMN